jgi:hypothetical protein
VLTTYIYMNVIVGPIRVGSKTYMCLCCGGAPMCEGLRLICLSVRMGPTYMKELYWYV